MILFPELLPLTPAEGGAYLNIKVTPKASKQRCGGLQESSKGSVLKVFVTVAPEKGLANEAVLKFLSEALGYPRACLVLVQGQTTPLKKILIKGMWEEIVQNVQNIL